MSELDRLLRLLGDVRQKLGRMPRRPEYLDIAKVTTEDIMRATGGGYAKLVEISGLKFSAAGKRDKQELRRQTFEHNIKEIEARRSVVLPPKISARHIFISDMHHPYGHPDMCAFLFALDDKYRFDRVTIGGDEIDGHSWSFHDKDPDLLSPGHELDLAIKKLQPLFNRWPEVDVLESNHGSLLFRKQKHHGLPRHVIKPYGEVLGAPPGWKWHDELIVQFSNGKKALVAHSYGSNPLQCSQKRGMSYITFHLHSKFSIQYWMNLDELMFAMQCGCLIDDFSRAFSYNKLTIERPIIGVGAVMDGMPRLFPMLLDKQGRWTGVVP